jgi:6-phosphogluconolactonase
MTVYSYPESIEVAAGVGKHILAQQNEALKRGDDFKVAVSGGSLGKVLKKALIDNGEISAHIQWDKWKVYFSDERLVPLDHADSNYGLFNQNVLQHLSVKPQVYTIDDSLLTGSDGQVSGADISSDEKIAAAYQAQLPDKLDLILLGCGPDGHTCSLFPGHPLLNERSKSIAYISDSPKPPPRRITFTFPVLEKAGSIAFVAEGADKAPVLKQIFNDPSSKLPSQLVNNLGSQVCWFVNDNTLTGVDVITAKY